MAKANRGLGKGLGALLGAAALRTDTPDNLYLPISPLEPYANQPRRHFDEEALQDLADSIRDHGIIQPLTVRRLSSGYYQIIAGERRWLIPDGLLQCSMEASSKEVFDTVTRIVEEVAEEYGANAAVAVSKAKAYVAENADESDELAPWDMGEEVFEDEPLQKRFEQALADEARPEGVVVEKNVAKRGAKSHKIRTDTGIDITFPAEYGENPDFIEFVSGPNGLINIELKNIGHIGNRWRPRGPILQPAAAPASPGARRMRQ